MGQCCTTRSERRERGSIPLNQRGGPSIGSNRPLISFDKYTTPLKEPPGVILKKREVFWETQPNYGGRVEVWQMMRMIAEAEDLATAQAILDSENLTCPSGRLTDGVYDPSGYLYQLQDYLLGVVVDLANVGEAEDSSLLNASLKSGLKKIDSAPVLEEDKFSVKVRLSNGIDLVVDEVYSEMAISKFLQLVKSKGSLTEAKLLRVVFLGKILEEKQRLKECNISEGTLIQVFVQ